MSSITFRSTLLTSLILFFTLKNVTAIPVKRQLIGVDLGGDNCFEVKRDLIYPDLGSHNCEGFEDGRGGRGYGYGGGYCCGY